MFKRIVLSLVLMMVGVAVTACAPKAMEQDMAGQPSHERHATGLESQVGDY